MSITARTCAILKAKVEMENAANAAMKSCVDELRAWALQWVGKKIRKDNGSFTKAFKESFPEFKDCTVKFYGDSVYLRCRESLLSRAVLYPSQRNPDVMMDTNISIGTNLSVLDCDASGVAALSEAFENHVASLSVVYDYDEARQALEEALELEQRLSNVAPKYRNTFFNVSARVTHP
jgi:hypothetical protein